MYGEFRLNSVVCGVVGFQISSLDIYVFGFVFLSFLLTWCVVSIVQVGGSCACVLCFGYGLCLVGFRWVLVLV